VRSFGCDGIYNDHRLLLGVLQRILKIGHFCTTRVKANLNYSLPLPTSKLTIIIASYERVITVWFVKLFCLRRSSFYGK